MDFHKVSSFCSVSGAIRGFPRPSYVIVPSKRNVKNEKKLIGSLLPENREPPFSQLYVWDTEQEINNRISRLDEYNYHLDPNIVLQLQEMLHEVNPYVEVYKNWAAADIPFHYKFV